MAALTRDVEIPTADGTKLAATCFHPVEGNPRRGIVIAGGTGIPRGFYGRLARRLADRGFWVLSFDYRGIGGSRIESVSRSRARMSDWGERDLPAAMSWLRQEQGLHALGLLGHSTGGQLLGLLPVDVTLDAAFLVASQTGSARFWTGWQRIRLLGVWYGLVPVVTLLRRHLPGRLMGGGGEDLPSGVAREWAKWGRHRDYILSHRPEVRGRFAAYRCPVRLVSVEGDVFFAPQAAVDELGSWFSAATLERLHLPSDPESGESLGHFGFFGGRGRAYWPDVVEFFSEHLSH